MRYKVVNFKFDMAAFSTVLKNVNDGDVVVFARVIGVDESTLRNWRTGYNARTSFPHPSMSNFIAACNALDLDPRDFFILED